MGRGIYFNGTTTTGVLDSTINLADGESFETDFMSQAYSSGAAVNQALASSADGTDRIMVQYVNGSNLIQFAVYIDSVLKTNGDDSAAIFDGDIHRITVSRSGVNFVFAVDGVTVSTIVATAGTFSIDYIGKDMANTDYFESFLGNIVIGSSTYPGNEGSGTTLADSSVAGNDITLTDPSWAALSRWEWVGDFSNTDRSYSTPNTGVVNEKRKEATRRRVVCGFSMTDSILLQAGDELDSVTALNGTQATTITSVDGSGSIDCDVESFAPNQGTSIFYQNQNWVSWANS